MNLGKGKSDRKDALWIMRYSQPSEVKQWQPEEPVILECRQLEQAIEQLIKQKTMVTNFFEALIGQPVTSGLVV